MQVNIFCIQKNDEFSTLNEKYSKLICKYATLKEFNIFNKKIAHAQKLGPMQAKKSYEEAIIPYKKGYCMVLDERGKNLTSKEFAKLIQDKNEISFFIGGAYGLSEEFGCSFDFKFSLSKLTLAHQFVKALLLEQIYRAFCINNHHPYHK
ncbi:23S rRNA (pseudouridine(1915)-N(3))-methyltransferase RlmH [Campylobacter sp. VicNov18]|uniref:23S rRNA (pseudouridine(1915)-N(3))-methyltransferase RlmH n=1 Tax=Campylobacter bilis TaxID=2691918 RepID=UPI00130DC076|nr:23S rRNA (pseudouridine(1915)-N(3))-methyltransferase RlmH [Campylobacter bilis]MCC8277230.1 23S rRNA (pseudouridine(1915)-N(3))-methyltransferase RlmH [Campylobacter bilis]MCC8298973.1 23S rRNA (pseudouridine(1915)-N(3))-methyltransferase RlmH [Campylobacter bilis]MCC8300139.1 23S rRNA (pseudouridine(1915)-N(3))-methyltransferase RlmH [Campylobacter bilis]MCC8349299.1 23S rRNA (pseudouridine(1915)-N(3))-methyltransferase RlmH [Campylobacter bilis]MCC8355028.1 23S rRNA (pseudouridine(1915)-